MRSKFRRLVTVSVAVGLLAVAGLVTVISLQAQVPLPGPHAEKPQDRPINSLRDLNQAFIDIAAMVKPAVVTVSTEKTLKSQVGSPFGSPFAGDPFFGMFFGPQGRGGGGGNQPREQEYRQQGLGSGVIVSADGRILTNNHVIDNVDSIFVRTFNGERYPAKLLGADPKTDVAVLQIDAKNLDYLKIGDSDSLQVGEMVLAVGSPLSENLAYTVTQGIVSAKGRSNVGLADYEDFIQTDAAINRGNSGGPMVNLDGELVGLNTAILSSSGGFQGIGMAVPSNMAVRVMESLISDGRVVRGWLGVSIQDLTQNIAQAFNLKQTGGALIGEVVEDSPAGKSGLQAGDIIVSVDGSDIDNSTHLRNRIAATKPNTKVTLGVMRGDEDLKIDVKLGEIPSDGAATPQTKGVQDRLGFAVATLNQTLARQFDIDRRLSGVVVTSVEPSSAAAQAGLREGDLIRGVYRRPVETEEDFYGAVEKVESGETVVLRVSRNGGGFYIAFRMD